MDNFSKFGWTVLLKYKGNETKEDSFENLLVNLKGHPNLIISDSGKDFYNIPFQNFLNNNNFRHYSRISSIGGVFAERFTRTIRYLLRRPVLEKSDGNWIDILPTITKQ